MYVQDPSLQRSGNLPGRLRSRPTESSQLLPEFPQKAIQFIKLCQGQHRPGFVKILICESFRILEDPPAANLKGVTAARELCGGGVPQAAVFDTSFHSTMPDTSYLYALPYQLYVRHRVRRYGFHGTSHRYVAYRYRQLSGKSHEETNIITIHLGNGSSACAIRNGESLDTSMGMTPLEGLVMGTRCGDIYASVLEFLHHKEGMSFEELDGLLNKRSGLLGISGLTNDMRDLLEEESEHQDRRAHLAIEIFCLRVKKYLGSYLARMNGADAIVFTGGIGENSPDVRARICRGLDFLGIAADPERNAALYGGKEGEIGTPTGPHTPTSQDSMRTVASSCPASWTRIRTSSGEGTGPTSSR